MNKLKSLATVAFVAAISGSAQASDFFDTSKPKNIFDLGARVGFNISNQTHNPEGTKLNLDKWGTGFDAGVICDINIKDYISIQPGFFFESRSHDYAYIYPNEPLDYIRYGHTRNYTFTVPILVSLRLNPADNIRWSVDLGPYFQFGLGGSDKGEENNIAFKDSHYDFRHKFDIGLKIGTGIKFMQHYYIGVHYLSGFKHVWKDVANGHNKAWTFTIGYDF